MTKEVLVATDGSDHATKAVEYASVIAFKYGAAIHLVHVLKPARIREYTELVEAIGRTAGGETLEEAEREVKEKGVKSVQSRLVRGDPAEEILKYAKKNKIDIIFMGSRGVGEVEGLLLGSVSHKVSHLAECTCVMVK